MFKSPFVNKRVYLKLCLKLFDNVVAPTAVYSLATTPLTARQKGRLASARAQMLRRIVGFRKADHESLEEAGHQCKRRVERAMTVYKVSDWLEVIDTMRWNILRRVYNERNGWPSLAIRWRPEGSRRVGRPRTKWTDSIDHFFPDRFNASLERELRNAQGRFSDDFRAEYILYMHAVVQQFT